MSLIADALKAAQQERTDRSGGVDSARKRQAAVSALRTSAEFSPPRRAGGGQPLPRALWVSLGIFAIATAGAIAFVLRVPPPAEEAAVPDAIPSSDAAATGEAPRTELAYVDLGALPVEPAPGPIYSGPAEYIDPVPPAAVQESDPAPAAGAPRTMAERAAAVIAAAQDLISNGAGAESAAVTPQPASSPAGRTPPPVAEAPPGRFEIRIGGAAAASAPSFTVAVAAQRRGDYRTAVQQYLAVLEGDGGNVEALNNLGASHQALGDLPRARQSFERAIELQPSYAAAWSNLGLVLGAMGLDQEALAALAEAIRLEPGNSGTRVNLALAYERTGRAADARRVLEEVVRADPQHPEAHYALGRLLEQAGDAAGAASHYRVFLTFGATRFPHLDIPVRERIRLLEAASGR
jgi:tetratricopeptide (TPR) repeat protein